MSLELRPCVLTLLLVYPVFLVPGILFFRSIVRNKPLADARRNRQLTIIRFFIFVVLAPLGAMLAVAVLGWLDPVYFYVRDL